MMSVMAFIRICLLLLLPYLFLLCVYMCLYFTVLRQKFGGYVGSYVRNINGGTLF